MAVKKCTICKHFDKSEYEEPCNECYNFHELESPESHWISVKDRLPLCGERVLISNGSSVFEAYLSISHKWVRCGIGWYEVVTHWMPLPEPPKEEQ